MSVIEPKVQVADTKYEIRISPATDADTFGIESSRRARVAGTRRMPL